MRRILLGTFVSAVVPAASLAHRGERGDRHREHARHHERRHHERRHHHKVRHERIGSDPAGSAEEGTAGTIASFTGGVLTITLNDRSTVSGQVTADARIECEAAEPGEMQRDDNGGDGGDRGGQGDQGDRGDDRGDQGDEQQCSTDALKSGTAVQEAELKISSAGAVWDEMELQAPQH